jgi:hypothetical protein
MRTTGPSGVAETRGAENHDYQKPNESNRANIRDVNLTVRWRGLKGVWGDEVLEGETALARRRELSNQQLGPATPRSVSP